MLLFGNEPPPLNTTPSLEPPLARNRELRGKSEALGLQHLERKNKELRGERFREVAGSEARDKKPECPQKRVYTPNPQVTDKTGEILCLLKGPLQLEVLIAKNFYVVGFFLCSTWNGKQYFLGETEKQHHRYGFNEVV